MIILNILLISIGLFVIGSFLCSAFYIIKDIIKNISRFFYENRKINKELVISKQEVKDIIK